MYVLLIFRRPEQKREISDGDDIYECVVTIIKHHPNEKRLSLELLFEDLKINNPLKYTRTYIIGNIISTKRR